MSNAAEPLLIDTNVLIDYLRGVPEAIAYMESLANPLFLCTINVGELYAGVRDGDERLKLGRFMLAFTILTIDYPIAVTAGLWRRDYGKSHGTGLADALIAASAYHYGLRLVTLNAKHFPIIPDVVVPY